MGIIAEQPGILDASTPARNLNIRNRANSTLCDLRSDNFDAETPIISIRSTFYTDTLLHLAGQANTSNEKVASPRSSVIPGTQ